MELPVNVLVVSDSPIVGRAVKQLLDLWPGVCRSELIGSARSEVEGGGFQPDALLVSPQTWEAMARWLPSLRRQYARCPWILLAEPRLAGMFLSYLEEHPCMLVGLDATPERLQNALLSLAGPRGLCLCTELQSRFAQGASKTAVVRWARFPSPMELQCGCAVSLGLSNRRIAEVLHLGEATVKTHVHHLLQKLGMSNRVELGLFVQRALALSPSPLH